MGPHGEPLDDPELVAAAQRGDPGSFAALHRRYERLVARVVRAETGGSAETPDLVQETFARAWARLGSLRRPDRFRPWLLQIARRAVIDASRAAGRRPALDGDDDAELARAGDPEPGPEELAALAELAAGVRVAIGGLSRRDATAITLAAQFGFSPGEIAEALDMTPNNAKVVLHRARARLRASLAEMASGPGGYQPSTRS